MDGITRKQLAMLLLGLFFGYSFFQMYSEVEKSTRPIDEIVTRRFYRYSTDRIVEKVDDLEVHFKIIPGYEYNYRYSALRSGFINVSLVNPTQIIKWITLQENYYQIEIYSDQTLLYSFNGESDKLVESETVFLAPHGLYNVFFLWGGTYENEFGRFYLPTGVYEIKCRFYLGDKVVLLEGIAFESYTKIGYSGVPV